MWVDLFAKHGSHTNSQLRDIYTMFSRRQFLSVTAAQLAIGVVGRAAYASGASSEKLRFAFSEDSAPYSWQAGDGCKGILPDLVATLLSQTPALDKQCSILPWKRAQAQLRKGDVDCFFTYPSEARQEYATFMSMPLFEIDYGYIVFNKYLPEARDYQNILSFDDLKNKTFFGERGSGWEEENIPQDIARKGFTDLEDAMRVMLVRDQPGFMVMPLEQARQIAERTGFPNKLASVKADFIPNWAHPFPYRNQKIPSESCTNY